MSNLQRTLQECAHALDESSVGEVPWGWRIRLWQAMSREFPDDSLFRRSVLSYVVAKRTISNWNTIAHEVDNRFRALPGHLMRRCRLLILKDRTAVEESPGYDVFDDIEAAMSLWDNVGNPAWCPLACYAAIQCATSWEEGFYEEALYPLATTDNFLETCVENNEGWESWDTHFWASCVAGGYPGLKGFEINKRRDFWSHWLIDDVSAILGNMNVVISLLHER